MDGYMLEHGIPRLFDEMLGDVLKEKPDNVLDFLSQWIDSYKHKLSMPIKVYYHPFSQPSRAVLWFIKHNKIPVEEHVVDLAKGEARSANYLENVNAFGGVPAILDDGLRLSEAAAILSYLCGKYRLEKYYPSNLRDRAEVDRVLHWHHTHLRLCSSQLIFPVLAAFVRSDPDPMSKGDFAKVEPQLKAIDKILSRQSYLAGHNPTIADFLAVPEVDQLEWAGFLDVVKYSNVSRWLESMAKLEGYGENLAPKEQLRKWRGVK
eukprot:NODE_1124_length_1000_cov_85.265750_g1079_i0.p1 GENE.NODE_1124_length_1000_cov_85.265750_g1079_i0~~NODE_1124_length_1000_cov_85.265750_g1079_i0.p1  ORF type:complete len:263 (-),score=34.82 NODE_1124_length_1000_cov_85.265750_g1079_i0:149-937(-)